MTIDRSTIVFFDASCLIAASGTPSGGSGFLLSLCSRGYLQAAVSAYVLTEAARNIQARMKSDAWSSYQTILTSTRFILASVPAPLSAFPPVNAKDVHVVAAASSIATAYLLTLDKGLIAEVSQANLAYLALAPGDFIKNILPTHVVYPVFP